MGKENKASKSQKVQDPIFENMKIMNITEEGALDLHSCKAFLITLAHLKVQEN